MLIVIIGAVILLAIDLITKAIFTGTGFNLIPGFLSIHPIRNYGAAFGILQDTRLFLIAVTFIILAAGIAGYIYFKDGRQSKVYNIGCMFVLGGAVGNLFDRLFIGYVRDFLSFDFINFPVFNMADVFLNVGMVLFVVFLFFIYKGKRSANNS